MPHFHNSNSGSAIDSGSGSGSVVRNASQIPKKMRIIAGIFSIFPGDLRSNHSKKTHKKKKKTPKLQRINEKKASIYT
jgi:hypothetical protein